MKICRIFYMLHAFIQFMVFLAVSAAYIPLFYFQGFIIHAKKGKIVMMSEVNNKNAGQMELEFVSLDPNKV